MKRFLLVILLFVLLFSQHPQLTQAATPPQKPAWVGEVLCLPGVYLSAPQDCIPSGPSSYLTRMAGLGITFPMRPFQSTPLDPQLFLLPYNYATLSQEDTPVYATLEEAIKGTSPVRMIGAGKLKYISYSEYEETIKGRFFQLRSGGWVQVSSRVSVPHSYPGGLTFEQTPQRPFGWILPLAPTVETQNTPGYKTDDYSGNLVSQYDLVQVYAVEQVGDTEWYMIGPDEWVDQRWVGRVVPNTTPPEGVVNGRWIEINLFEQTLSVYENHELIYAALIASGLDPFYTRPGLFSIYKKHESTPMAGAFEADRSDFYYLEDVPWTMYYDKARALHGAYWRTAFGFPQSHGCVNLSPGDAHWLYNWAQEGDWVFVWDPSGETPTDPDYYGEGGA